MWQYDIFYTEYMATSDEDEAIKIVKTELNMLGRLGWECYQIRFSELESSSIVIRVALFCKMRVDYQDKKYDRVIE